MRTGEAQEYTIIRSRRRTISIEIDREAKVIVRAPLRMSDRAIDDFVRSRSDWIEKHILKMKQRGEKRSQIPEFSEAEREKTIERALSVIPERVRYYAPLIGVTYGKITIRDQKTLWGSCSAKGNLNFNYILAALPDKVLDYVVVHELCHRKEMNHSQRFWSEVEKVMPDYRTARKWLKDEGALYLENKKRG